MSIQSSSNTPSTSKTSLMSITSFMSMSMRKNSRKFYLLPLLQMDSIHVLPSFMTIYYKYNRYGNKSLSGKDFIDQKSSG